MTQNNYAKHYSDVSEKLKKLRPYKVSEETGISYGTIYNITQGKANPTIETLEKLRAYLKTV